MAQGPFSLSLHSRCSQPWLFIKAVGGTLKNTRLGPQISEIGMGVGRWVILMPGLVEKHGPCLPITFP